ncbi:MAG TPA: adenylate/guanylate cyclase domain-containing protein [Spirochaetales bacterium]|nr:adenylate/guanylate cyclase domain-containing protein [Spirochaetales bacterium]HRZ64047.1 adenylate/guanylate cyclase domain-containing protein [Spirochaetia bacterium]
MSDRDNLKAGERRVAAILFSDMKGFTSLSERMDPEEMDGLMSRVFGLFESIIREHGGIVEKYIGDALVAVFGVPELHEDDPSRAVHAALEFLSRARGADGRLAFRTGIHSGLVTTGRRGEFDVVTGHAMSVAQRLEAAAEPGEILVSEAVKEKCEESYEFAGPRSVEAKGKTEPIVAYAVRGESSGALRGSGPFVGRRELLDELLKAYIRNRYDEVSGFFLSGDAGSGKSRLLQAFVEKIRLFPDFSTPILQARAQKFRPGGFSVVVDMLLGCLGLGPGADRAQARAALAALPEVKQAQAERFVRLVCCRDEEEPPAPASGARPAGGLPEGPGSAIGALYDVFDAVLERHSQDLFPILVCIDNANLMDRQSREFFQYFFRTGRVKPFFLLAGRDFPPELRRAFQGVKPLRLPPLAKEESEALVRALWPDAPAEALARVLEAGMGNPLFLREYAAYARKRRDSSALPATVQNIFLASLERYPPAWCDLLKRASVFVHSFTAEEAAYLQEASGAEAGFVGEALARLASDGLLAEEGGAYSFRVDVYKKALYASLLNHNKRVLHGRVAELLLARERPDRLRLVHHLVRSERYDEASRALLEDPNRTYNRESLPYVDILIRRLEGDEKASFRLLMTKAAVLFNYGKIEESERILKRIMRVALARKDATLMGYAYHQICAHAEQTCSYQKAMFAGQKALYYYRRSDIGVRSVQNLLGTMSTASMMRDDFEEARRLVAQCEAVPGGDPREAESARAAYHYYSGDYARALASVERLLGLMPEEYRGQLYYVLSFKMKVLWRLCDFAALGEAASTLLSLGPLADEVLSKANAALALSLHRAGEREQARDRFVQAEFYAGQVKNDFERVEAQKDLALCRYLAGETRKAESTALEALALGLRHSCFWPTFSLLVLLAESCLGRGKEERARFFLVEASYFFTTGLLLPPQDLVLYYYLAAKLLDPDTAGRNLAVARRLLEEEKARIGRPELVAAFLSLRSYGAVEGSAPEEA